jgi:hypothetical protein
MDKVGEVLMAAAELVEKGWCQNKGEDGDRVCASLALLRSNSSGFDPGVYFNSLRRLERAAGIQPGFVVHWNDTPQRTQAQVVTALRMAAELPA